MADSAPMVISEMTLARAKRGDQRAFDTIYASFQPILLRHLRLTCGAKAEDVAAAAWESVARSIDGFDGDGDGFRRWLFTIARRRLVDELRRDARRPVAVADIADHDQAIEPVDELESADWISGALRRLPTRQAEVISLRVVGGLDVADVAELLGISEGNVRVLSHRGLSALRDLLDEEGGSPAGSEKIWQVL